LTRLKVILNYQPFKTKLRGVCYKATTSITTNRTFIIMYIEREISEEKNRLWLTNKAMAALLGLSLTEYHTLSHRPLEALGDMNGNVLEFYIHISPNNKPHILNKLKIDRNNFVRFTPEEVYNHSA
jgi:hypothetical protein